MTKRYKLECLGNKDVTMIVDDEKGVAFDGWDERAEMAFIGFGDTERSPCWIVARALDEGALNENMSKYLRWNDIETARTLILAGADVHVNNEEPLRNAVFDGNTDAVRMLLECEADVHVNNEELLGEAIRQGLADVVKVLLEHGADLRVNDGYRFSEAHYYYVEEVIEVIENWIVAQAIKNNTLDEDLIFYSAIEIEWPGALIEALVSAGADINARNGAALRNAVEEEDISLIKALLKNGADANIGNGVALKKAAKYNNFCAAETLLEHGADVHIDAALQIAVAHGSTYVVELLEAWIAEHPDD